MYTILKFSLSFLFVFFHFTANSQTSFYFYNFTSPNNGSLTNTGNSWSTPSFPTFTDAENNTNTGCLTMNYVATINGGTYVNSTGSATSSLTPKWQNVGVGNDYYGQRIYVNFTTSNSTTSFATVTYSFTQSAAAINLPITFDMFDINSGAYVLTTKALNFIDIVEITAKNAAGTAVSPVFSN